MVYADGGAQHTGIALTGSQMRSERRLEGTRGNTKAGQKKRSEAKYGCGGDGVAGVGTEHKLKVPKRQF